MTASNEVINMPEQKPRTAAELHCAMAKPFLFTQTQGCAYVGSLPQLTSISEEGKSKTNAPTSLCTFNTQNCKVLGSNGSHCGLLTRMLDWDLRAQVQVQPWSLLCWGSLGQLLSSMCL